MTWEKEWWMPEVLWQGVEVECIFTHFHQQELSHNMPDSKGGWKTQSLAVLSGASGKSRELIFRTS